MAEVWLDTHVYNTGMVTIVEIMGRHAGWLTAASELASLSGCGPDLIYMPETDFDLSDFLDDVGRIYRNTGNCVVAVSEGVHLADGSFVSEGKVSATDGFGHAQLVVWPASWPRRLSWKPAQRSAALNCPCSSAVLLTAPLPPI